MSQDIHTRRRFLQRLGLSGCGLALSACLTPSSQEKSQLSIEGNEAKKAQNTPFSKGNIPRPNFIFILTDDQGWQDLGCYGHPYIKTPNLDRLAAEGIRFEQFYSSASVCSPSRTAYMTGHYPARHRIHGHLTPSHERNQQRGMPDWLEPNEEFVTRLLQKAGYRTGHFGKWHLGNVKDAPEPNAYGIDEYRVFHGRGPGWDRNGNPASTDLAFANAKIATNASYIWSNSTDVFVDQAISFVENNKDSLFYLNLWTVLPHAPIRPSVEQLQQYDELTTDLQDFESWMRDYLKDAQNLQQKMKNYCAAVGNVDTAIGRLLNRLDDLNLTENTFIFFTSDNGPESYHVSKAQNAGVGSSGIFRGRKRSLYEGGIRMPCIARWPNAIQAGRVDSISVIAAVDWLPTVCHLADISLPNTKLDGQDISSVFSGETVIRQQPLFWEWLGGVGIAEYTSPSLAVRDGDWKLFAQPNGRQQELYNIPDDPEERNNLTERHPDMVARLLPMLQKWKRGLPR
ncbi:MAG: sulfatase-like hydrolase/transferase [Cyanobacteria bacterium P01_H01_bin.105]